MAIKYLAGERIIGTAAERAAMTTGMTDTLGSSANGTMVSVSLVTSGQKVEDGCYDFERGSAQEVQVLDSGLSFMVGKPTFTLAYWCNPDSFTGLTSTAWFFGSDDSSGGHSSMTAHLNNDGSIHLSSYGGSWTGGTPADNSASSACTLSANTWQHLAFVSDTTSLRIYKNGVLTDTFPWSSNSSKNLVMPDPDQMKLGQYSGSGNVNSGLFDGQLDDLGLWNVALPVGNTNGLTANSINYLYNGDSPRPCSTIPTGLKIYFSMESDTNDVCINDAIPTQPNLPNGTLFEETDTGTHYMWDGTDTWNEVT